MSGWMVSHGLDVSIDPVTPVGFIVKHGNIVGKLLSIQQGENVHKIVYSTKDVKNCFDCLDNKPSDLLVSYADSFYKIALKAYNYKLDTSGTNLIVTIEELDEKTN
jgi:hypothetical protein